MKLSVLAGQEARAMEALFEEKAAAPPELADVRVKRILVAVDFSEASRRALEYAVTLARKLEAEIALVHVFEGVPGELKILEAAIANTSFRKQARESLAGWERELGSIGLTAKTVFREGTAIAREILETAKEYKADLVVMGRHGTDSLLLENTVKKVVGHASCPVLVGP